LEEINGKKVLVLLLDIHHAHCTLDVTVHVDGRSTKRMLNRKSTD